MIENFKKIKLEDMVSHIEENGGKNDKAWFKSIAFDEKGKYQHLIAKKAFCEKYMPELLPVAKEKKPKASELLAKW